MSRARQLTYYLAEVQAKPFDWAAWNCCHFAAGWVRRFTGFDPMAGLPTMDSRLSAHRVIASLGGSLRRAWSSRLHAADLLPSLARPGDVVLVAVDGVDAVGLCAGRTAAVLTERGVAHVPMTEAAAAWRLEP